EIENLSGWLTTVVARVSLNMLRSRAVRREQPLSPHLPDPIIDPVDGVDPEHEALLADSVGLAMLVVLETLTPPERLAFVLHDMFGVAFEDIATLLDRSPNVTPNMSCSTKASRTTCLGSRSRTSPPSSTAPRRRPASWPAGAAAASALSPPPQTLTCTANDRSSMRSWRRRRGPGLRIGRGTRRAERGATGDDVVAGRPHHAPCTRQRCRRHGHHPQRRGVLDRFGHRPQRKDRRARLPRRPGTARPPRRDDSRQPYMT